ncbi:MAG: hypothetical protein LUC89_08660 [Oscillospiraceae bacterium]|nr:hypothetical protein [Oscillospiraceae bacterium]
MAILPYSFDNGQPIPWEYYPVAGGEDLYVGLGMAVTDGQLGPSTEPTFISLREEEAPAAGTVIPVMRLTEGVVYEIPLNADSAGLQIGVHAGIADDCMTITPGLGEMLEIVGFDGEQAGDLCRCRFIGE